MNTTIEIKSKELEQTALTVLEQSHRVIVVDENDKLIASQLLGEVNSGIKLVQEEFKEPKELAFAAHKSICALETKVLKPYKDAYTYLQGEIINHANVEAEKQRKLQAEADRIAHEEQARLEAEWQKEIDEAKSKGDNEFAQELEATPVYVPPAIIPQQTQKTVKTDAGSVSLRTELVITIRDEKMVLQGILMGKIPIAAVTINPAKLKTWAKDNKVTPVEAIKWGIVITETHNTNIRK